MKHNAKEWYASGIHKETAGLKLCRTNEYFLRAAFVVPLICLTILLLGTIVNLAASVSTV